MPQLLTAQSTACGPCLGGEGSWEERKSFQVGKGMREPRVAGKENMGASGPGGQARRQVGPNAVAWLESRAQNFTTHVVR